MDPTHKLKKNNEDLEGFNLKDTIHSKEHEMKLERLAKQSSQFNSKVIGFKKKMKGMLKNFKVINKSLLASYQITTLSHLIISIIEKDQNFEKKAPNEVMYSMNRRKVNSGYFDKKPRFKKIVEKWENKLMEAL
jgi:predicted metal-dependent hydrolase